METDRGKLGSFEKKLFALGRKRTLPFTVFFTVVLLLIYLFSFYLFGLKGVITNYTLNAHTEQLVAGLLNLNHKAQESIEDSGDPATLTEERWFIETSNRFHDIGFGDPFIISTDSGSLIWPKDADAAIESDILATIDESNPLGSMDSTEELSVSSGEFSSEYGYYQFSLADIGDGYKLGILRDQTSTFTFVKKFEKILAGFLGLGFLFFMVFFITIIKILTYPLREIRSAAREISQGDYNSKLDLGFALTREVRELSQTFNVMSRELETRRLESQAHETELRESNDELESAVTKLSQKYKEVKNLNNISYQLHRVSDSEHLLHFALEHILGSNDLCRVVAYMREETGHGLLELSFAGESDDSRPSEDAFEQCFRSESPVLVKRNGVTRPRTRQLLIPTALGESISGVLLLESSNESEFGVERIDYFSHLTNHIFSVIRNKILLQDSLKKTEELRRINSISERISGELNFHSLFSEISRSVRTSLGASACAVLTREGDGTLKTRSVEMDQEDEGGFSLEKISQGVLQYIVDTQEPMLISDSENDARLDEYSELATHGFRSMIGTPMFYQGNMIGIICAMDKAIAAFDEKDVSFLSTVSNQTATALENATLFDIIRERDDRRERQLTVAQKFQRDRIPTRFEKGKIEIHSMLSPAEELAGDFFDVFDLGPSTISFVIGDVATKGIPASLMTFSLLSMFRRDAKIMRSPATVLETVNQTVFTQVKEDTWFTTCFYGKLNISDLTLVYAKAGHELPILHKREHGGDVELLDAGGIPLGINEETRYEARQIQLEHGDRLVMFTDGVVEAVNPEGDRFGRGKLATLVGDNSDCGARELGELIVGEVNRFTGSENHTDDILVAVLDVKADPWVRKSIRYSESAELVEEIMNQLKLNNLDSSTTYAIRLSIDESFTNAFRHGNTCDDEKLIDVAFLMTTEKFCMSVRDTGSGFNYESLPDPTVEENLLKAGGRGVFLMRQLIDEVDFNEKGNEIHILKYFNCPDVKPDDSDE